MAWGWLRGTGRPAASRLTHHVTTLRHGRNSSNWFGTLVTVDSFHHGSSRSSEVFSARRPYDGQIPLVRRGQDRHEGVEVTLVDKQAGPG